ncbi:uncharacterized protein B0H18DRAFT_975524 [Fomitopsis serialis]|uniref:uncharacterized protein n=1 Tax=Fomitopsis serialis TaxID=139415 RepID=UPI0020076337|nr:uncharacterized protein B0H18DRAFT_975524 [Neoantrodia serialis]KAH9935361.1 hypothetical protein B0H18DRAFT_975524 [Neoantrodia serialis]
MRLLDLDEYSLSSVVSFLDRCDSLSLSLTSRRIHPLAKHHALSAINIKTAAQLERISSYLLADVTNRLHFVRALTVSRAAFGSRGRYEETQDFSAATLLADVLELAPHMKMLRLEAAGALFEAEPRIASVICRLNQLLDLDLRDLTSDSFEVVGRLSCTPRRLSLHDTYSGSDEDRCDATSLLSAPVMQSVRSLHLYHLRIADQQPPPVDGGVCHAPLQWPELRDLKIEYTYVSVATLVHAFPTVKSIHFDSRQSMEEWEKKDTIEALMFRTRSRTAGSRSGAAGTEGFPSAETACWGYLDRAYGTSEDFTQWKIACKIRWLMLGSESKSSAPQILPILQRTSPVVLSLQDLPAMLDMTFWQDFIHSAPRIRYLDLTISSDSMVEVSMYWTSMALSALSRLPLVALRLCRKRVSGIYMHDMDESRVAVYPRWSSVICSLAVLIAGTLTSLHVISVGEGVQVLNDELSRYRFCGHALWWRIVPNDEPPSANVDRDEDAGEVYTPGALTGIEDSSTHDGETIDPNPKLTKTLGPNASRKMVPISRDLGEHIRVYMESSSFTETSAFNDELLERLARTAVPREVVSEP